MSAKQNERDRRASLKGEDFEYVDETDLDVLEELDEFNVSILDEEDDEGPLRSDEESENCHVSDAPVPAKQAPAKQVSSKTRGKVLKDNAPGPRKLTAKAKLLILKAFRSSTFSAKVFGPLVGVSGAAIYKWDKAFRERGPAGLESTKPGASAGSRLPEATKQCIVMVKEEHPTWGLRRIHDVLLRSNGFSASPNAIRKVLLESGFEIVEEGSSRHPDKPRRFERARPMQLWQTDLFTFVMKRQGYRVYLVAFMDDCSRFIVGFGLVTKATSAWVQEVLSEAIAHHGSPEEVLTDQGPQYYAWRGTSSFTKYLKKRGIRQLVARAHHPQTLGKIERFWQTAWTEFLEDAVFTDLTDARERVKLFIDWYNFQRTHQGIGGLVPADRFFGAEDTVRTTIEARVAANSLELARHGKARKPFYLTGRVGNEAISLHAEGEKVVLTTEGGLREEVNLAATGPLTVAKAGLEPAMPVDEAGAGETGDEDDETNETDTCGSGIERGTQ